MCAGKTRVLRYSEGISTTSPTPQTAQIGNFVTYASTTAFVTAKGTDARKGDVFVQSTDTRINFNNGDNWRQLPIVADGTFAKGDYIESHGTGFHMVGGPRVVSVYSEYTATFDDKLITAEATNLAYKINLFSASLSGAKGREIQIINNARYGYFEISGPTTSLYLSGTQAATLRSDGTSWVVVGKSENLVGYVKDYKADNTNGGTANIDAWRTRDLNVSEGDFIKFGSVTSNEFRLDPGNYHFDAHVPAALVNGFKARLYNNSGGTTLIMGQACRSAASGNDDHSFARVMGSFRLTSYTTCQVQMMVAANKTTTGFGSANGFGVSEIYTQARIEKSF